MPDVELGARRHVAAAEVGAAHDDEALDEARQFGLAHRGERNVGERSGGDQDQPPGVGVGRGDKRIDGMREIAGLGRIGQARIAEPGRAMDGAGVVRLGRERHRRARVHGHVGAAGERQHGAGVAGRVGEAHVADDGRDADERRLRLGARVEEREGVVDAGVDIDEQAIRLMGHGVLVFRISVGRPDTDLSILPERAGAGQNGGWVKMRDAAQGKLRHNAVRRESR